MMCLDYRENAYMVSDSRGVFRVRSVGCAAATDLGNEGDQVVKVLEFQLQLSPSNEYSGLISFRMD